MRGEQKSTHTMFAAPSPTFLSHCICYCWPLSHPSSAPFPSLHFFIVCQRRVTYGDGYRNESWASFSFVHSSTAGTNAVQSSQLQFSTFLFPSSECLGGIFCILSEFQTVSTEHFCLQAVQTALDQTEACGTLRPTFSLCARIVAVQRWQASDKRIFRTRAQKKKKKKMSAGN